MTLTAKQQKALDSAPASARAAMKAAFAKQLGQKSTDGSKRGHKKQVSKAADPAATLARKSRSTAADTRTLFDPTNYSIPPSLYPSIGVFPVNGSVRDDVVSVAALRYIMCVTAIPGRSTCGFLFRVAKSGATVATETKFYNLPTLNAAYNNGGPTSSRFSKVGFRVENLTPAMYQGGRVYVTHLTQRVALPKSASTMTADDWAVVVDGFRTMPANRTKVFTWNDFGASGKYIRKPFICTVTDEPKYNEFNTHLGPETTLDGFWQNVGVWNTPTASLEEPHPMSILFMHWDNIDTPTATSILQDITIQVDAQMLTRWPANTVLGQSHKDVPASKTFLASRPAASPSPVNAPP